MFGYCIEGRHQGTRPRYSKPCPGSAGTLTCDCTCHQPKFRRKKST